MTTSSISRRRFLALSGALGAASLITAACAVPAAAPAEGGMEDMAVTLSHWQHHSAGRAAAVEEFKAQFEEANPDVTIDFQSIPWAEYWGKLAAGIAGGAGSAPTFSRSRWAWSRNTSPGIICCRSPTRS